jgi:hypothetical protein
MKYLGSTSIHSDQRAYDLLCAYSRYIRSHHTIRSLTLLTTIVARPAPRFYVSSQRASIVISDMLRGRPLTSMHPSKQRMFQEIFRRVMELRKTNTTAPLSQLVNSVIEQPAPEFYITPSSAKRIIQKNRKAFFRNYK